MAKAKGTLEFKLERTIEGPVGEVFDGWLDPKTPGNPWNAAEHFLMQPKVGGLFYWALRGTAHYGRFTDLRRPGRIQHTWVSPNTLGEESVVTVTFVPKGNDTRMTLVHDKLPNHALAKGHNAGWDYFMGVFCEQFGGGSRKAYRWEEAHPGKKRG